MSPEFIDKWEHILEDVEKNKIPVEFIKKLIIKLEGKKQQTINIQKLLQQGLDPEQVEDAVSRKLNELEDLIVSVEFGLLLQFVTQVLIELLSGVLVHDVPEPVQAAHIDVGNKTAASKMQSSFFMGRTRIL